MSRSRSLISSLSENDSNEDRDRDYSQSYLDGVVSKSGLDSSQDGTSTLNLVSRSLSPTPSSTSLANYRNIFRLRKKIASTLFPLSHTPSSENSDAETPDSPFSPPDLQQSPNASSSGQSSPIRRSLSNLSHSSNSTTTSYSALRTRNRQRSQTLSSIENDPIKSPRRENVSLSGLSNLLSLRVRSDSEPNFSALKSSIQNSERLSQSQHSEPEHILPLSLFDRVLPDRIPDETPQNYFTRIEKQVGFSHIPSLVSKKDDVFFHEVLRLYCSKFDFIDEPIDMSLRKFILSARLPREAQQIDRVLDYFSKRYHHCNPGLFTNSDHAYVIAFSLMMLHTDAFNRSNKRKMQRADYVRNTQVDKIPAEILECFFDNITYTQFIHMDDENEALPHKESKVQTTSPILKHRKSIGLGKSSKEFVDIYAMIQENRLKELRPDFSKLLNLEDPYSYVGTSRQFDVINLHQSFMSGSILQALSHKIKIINDREKLALAGPTDVVNIRVMKVGTLVSLELKKGRISKSHWRLWGVILTLSKIYFFKNITWIRSLIEQEGRSLSTVRNPFIFETPIDSFHPDEVMSTESLITLLDRSYTGRKNAFVIIDKNGSQDWFMADNQDDMNDWIVKINYATTIHTAGVSMKGVCDCSHDVSPIPIQKSNFSKINGHTSVSSMFSSMFSDKDDESIDKESLSEKIIDDSGRKTDGSFSDGSKSSTGKDITIMQAIENSDHRLKLLGPKISELEDRLFTQTQELDCAYRTAKHLMVMTPVLNRSRESLVLGAGMVAGHIDLLRVEVMKLRCYREILVKELDTERDYNAELLRQQQQLFSFESTIDSSDTTITIPDSIGTEDEGLGLSSVLSADSGDFFCKCYAGI
ncbi:hypothetical protein V1511DRAFT_461702 [Dipodascopsis uninucleata]